MPAKKLEGALPAEDISAWRGVWVVAEHRKGVMAPVTGELLGSGRDLAGKLGVPLSAVVLGEKVEPLARECIALGADRALTVDHPVLSEYRTVPHAKAASILIRRFRPEVVLIGATRTGRDLASRVAVRVRTGITADCTMLDIDIEKRLLMAWRPAFGGRTMAAIVCERHRPQMATVRPGIMRPLPRDAARKGDIEPVAVELSEEEAGTRVVKFVPTGEENIQAARVIVAGGRGMGGKGGFAVLEELAQALNGVVAASRTAVDAGWISRDRQVGQTGKTVSPDLYIACGISGAVQHIAGMKRSRIVVAVNSDPNAQIFKYADLGIAGDYRAVVPEVVRALAKRKSRLKGNDV